MELDVTPPVREAELRAVREALAQASLSVDAAPHGYASPWRRVAVREAVDNAPTVRAYARSPRSTRGATSA